MDNKDQSTGHWILAKNNHIGQSGVFIAGRTYFVDPATLAAVQKEINHRRKLMPKDQRSEVKGFQYDLTVAPWEVHRNSDDVRLMDAQDSLTEIQNKLEALRCRQHELVRLKRRLEEDLNGYAKLSELDLQKPGPLNRLYRKTKANLEIADCEMEQAADDIKEHAAAANAIQKQIDTLHEAVSAKSKSL